MTNKEIKELVECSKKIEEKNPREGYKANGAYKRCDLTLSSAENMPDKTKDSVSQKIEDSKKSDDSNILEFHVFIRQNQNYMENFSIGLIYKFSGFKNGLNFVRYNGPHDSDSKIPHHLYPHIHQMTEEDIQSGSLNPKPTKVKKTNKYNSLEEGLVVFFKDIKVINWREYFPELEQGDLFNGY